MDLEALLAALAEIDTLDNDQLGDMKSQLTDAYKSLRKEAVTPEILEQLGRIAEGLQTIDATVAQREQEAAAIEAQLKELDAQVLKEAEQATKEAAEKPEPIKAEGEAGTPVEPAAKVGEPVAAAAKAVELSAEEQAAWDELSDADKHLAAAFATSEIDAWEALSDADKYGVASFALASAPEAEPEAVTAAALSDIAARQPSSAKPKPSRVTSVREPMRMTASANGDALVLAPIGRGREDGLAQTFANRLNGMGHVESGYRELLTLAHGESPVYDHTAPDFIGQDYRRNQEIFDETARRMQAGEPVLEAVTAAGGINAPRQPIYEIYHVGTSVRPVRDSIPSFNADRGGVRIVTPTPITSVGTTGGSPNQAMENITAATDAGGHTKVYQEFSAPSIVDYDVEANPLITQHGNMSQRYFPEEVQHDLANSEDAYARFSENLILTKMAALSTAITKTQVLGAASDILNTVNKAATQLRNRHRADPHSKVRVVLPYWVVSVFQRDLADRTVADPLETLSVSEAQVNSLFTNINVNVTWTIDGVGSAQIAPAQATGALNGDPTVVVWYMYLEGTFLYLDGGQLDLGVVRDSSLNAKNKYQIFREEFWNLAFQGLEAYKVQQTFCVNGATTGTITASSVCSGGS